MSGAPAFAVRCPTCAVAVPLEPRAADGETRCPAGHAVFQTVGGVTVLDDLPEPGDYPAELYALVGAVDQQHWWYASRNDVIRRALAPLQRARGLTSLVEVGCGTGLVLALFESMGFTALGLDMHAEGLHIARQRTRGPLVRSGAPTIPLVQPVDVVALCDVLEHADEAQLLGACRDALAPGGLLLVTVPARPSLWTLEDELVGHRRRYTRAALRRALTDNGFAVVRERPFHAAVTALAARGARQPLPPPDERPTPREFFERTLAVPGKRTTAVARIVLGLENRLGAVLPLPFASSLLMLAERRDA